MYLAGACENCVKLFHPTSYELQQSIVCHHDQVISVCFSGDGTKLATASIDETCKIWDMSSYQEIASIPCNPFHPRVWLNRTGNQCVITCDDEDIMLWQNDDNYEQFVENEDDRDGFVGYDLHQLCQVENVLNFTPDDRLLVLLGGDVGVFDTRTQETDMWDVFGDIRQHIDLNRVSVCPNHSTVAAVLSDPFGDDYNVRLFDVATRKTQTLIGNADTCVNLFHNADGSKVASFCVDGIVRIWETTSATLVSTIVVHSMRSIIFAPDGDRILCLHYCGLVRVFECFGNGEAIHSIDGVNSICFSPATTVVLM